MHFLTSIRVGAQQASPLTVIELYASYLLLSGLHRFQYEVSDRHNGHWWTFQLSHFTRALRIAQAHALDTPILAASDKEAPREEWTKIWNIPAQQVAIHRRLVICNHAEVRDFLRQWSSTPIPEGDHSVGAELWRRLPIGLSETQMLPGGRLSDTSLSWELPRVGQACA